MSKVPSNQQINTLLEYFNKKKYSEAKKIAINLTKEFPQHAFGWKALAVIFKNKGKIFESLKANMKAIEIDSRDFESHFNLGNTLKELNRLNESLESYQKAISINPKFADAYNNLGIVLRELNKLDESEASYQKAISINPKFADAYNNLGIVLRELNKLDESEASYQKAISINPKFADAYSNLGFTLREKGRLNESEASYQKAISINPKFAEAYNNLGFTLRELGKLEDSKNSFNKAIELKPDYPDAYNNLSLTFLMEGNFKKAYELSEWRWKTKLKIGNYLKSTKPNWNGENNSSVFVWKEQGIGDEIMYFSIIPELRNKSKKVIVNCDKRLIPLFKRSFSESIMFESEREKVNENNYDAHIPVASLPFFFRKDLKSFSQTSRGYLKADIKQTLKFKEKLKANKNTKIVGISWQTESIIQMASFRNIHLKDLAIALSVSNIKLLNLQYGDVFKELKDLKEKTNIEIIDLVEVDKTNDIDNLSSLISACDLVVSIDNFILHLAGSLGKKTMAILPFTADARWGQKIGKSHLYESVYIYRQPKVGDWNTVLKQLKDYVNNDFIKG